ncbi:mucin-2-like [Penaeus monodon]|uniref:mucin-2-like n=1 Tax=Penaeus monodon TaxID=6687 RepID=UPI0018A79ED8|nr:mucin-2-like [Penaeus monodon]
MFSVALPDGRVQVVTYIADEQGFRAEVTYEGEGTLFTTTPVPPHSSSRPPIYASAFSPAQKVPDDFHTHQADAKALSPSTSLHLRQPSVNHPRRPAPQPVRHQFNGHDQPIHQAPIHTPPYTPASHHSGAPTPPHHSRTFSPQPIHNSTSTTPNQNLHFGDHFHVTTASPNPFRLRNHATTTPTPPTPTSKSAHDASVPPAFEAPFAATARPITNAHVTDNGFRSTESSTTKTAAPPPANLYEYDPTGREVGAHTTLYNPDPDSRAYIHALGQAHAVPLLLPFSPPHPEGDEARTHPPHNVLPPPPRTYYLSQSSHSIPAYAPTAAPEIVRHLTPTPAHRAKSVEITRGDDQRPRISIKVPEPHEADIYPAPRPRLRLR